MSRFVPHWLSPAVLSLGLIGAFTVLMFMLAQRDEDASRADLDRHARTAAADVADQLESNSEYLRLFAEDLSRGTIDAALFEARVTQYLADHPALFRLMHVTSGGNVLQVIPEMTDESWRDSAAAAPELRAALDESQRIDRPTFSRPHVVSGSQRGFAFVVPLPDRPDEALVGIYDLDRLLRGSLSRETILLHQVGFVDSDGAVVSTLPALAEIDPRFDRIVALDPPGNGLRLRLSRYGTGLWTWGILALVSICAGLALGSAYAIWMLNRQIERRLIVEKELHLARDRLEDRVRERTADLVDANRRLEDEMLRRLEVEERSRRHQDQLAHVSRLSTMGEMAAGLAHEINQPLAAIAAYTRAGMRQLDSRSPDLAALREAMHDASEQAQRAGTIVHRLREFIAERATEHTPHDLSDLTRVVAELLQGEFKRTGVACTLELADNLPTIEVDAIQIEQVIMNMMRNGIEAMESVPADQRKLTVRTGAGPAGHVTLTVEDRGPGCGVDPPTRIFDPFFTTKDEGMGMGLSISQTIIEAHEGRVLATPRVGGGMIIGFHIPYTKEEAPHGGTEGTTRTSARKQPRTVPDGVRR